MPNFALLTDNVVKNIIVADSKEAAEQLLGARCVECSYDNFPEIGYTYDGETFSPPA